MANGTRGPFLPAAAPEPNLCGFLARSSDPGALLEVVDRKTLYRLLGSDGG